MSTLILYLYLYQKIKKIFRVTPARIAAPFGGALGTGVITLNIFYSTTAHSLELAVQPSIPYFGTKTFRTVSAGSSVSSSRYGTETPLVSVKFIFTEPKRNFNSLKSRLPSEMMASLSPQLGVISDDNDIVTGRVEPSALDTVASKQRNFTFAFSELTNSETLARPPSMVMISPSLQVSTGCAAELALSANFARLMAAAAASMRVLLSSTENFDMMEKFDQLIKRSETEFYFRSSGLGGSET